MSQLPKDVSDLYRAQGPEAVRSALEKHQKAFVAQTSGTRAYDDLPEIINADSFLSTPIVKPPQLIHGLLHQGSKMVVGGPSKSNKTWSLLDLGMSVATGSPWWGFQTTKADVLYINLELASFVMHQRMFDIQFARPEFKKLEKLKIWNLRGKAVAFEDLRPRIVDRIQQQYGLIIVDPIYKVYGDRDENSAGDMGTLLNEIERMAVQTGAAVVFGAHFSKGNQSGKESIDRISGSGVFARDPDTLLVMTKHEKEDTFTIEATLRNFKPIDPFCVARIHPLMVRDDKLDPTKLKRPGNKVSYTPEQLMEVLGEQSLTTSEWEKQVMEETGMSKRTFHEKLKVLKVDPTKVIKDAEGKWSKVKPTDEGSAELQ
jgi:RecA-family ATPase